MQNEYDFMEWYNYKASVQEKLLADKVSEYEYLFDDMLFENDDYDFCIPDEIKYFEPTQVQFKVENLIDSYGYYDIHKKVLCVDADHLTDTTTILHEMIHLYEEALEKYRYLHDILFWNLYTSLRDKIPCLDEILSQQAITLYQVDIMQSGGTHDILFILKSFDIDIKQGYPLGTVCSYGLNDKYKEYTYST